MLIHAPLKKEETTVPVAQPLIQKKIGRVFPIP